MNIVEQNRFLRPLLECGWKPLRPACVYYSDWKTGCVTQVFRFIDSKCFIVHSSLPLSSFSLSRYLAQGERMTKV